MRRMMLPPQYRSQDKSNPRLHMEFCPSLSGILGVDPTRLELVTSAVQWRHDRFTGVAAQQVSEHC
jgi:hypothetical protein